MGHPSGDNAKQGKERNEKEHSFSCNRNLVDRDRIHLPRPRPCRKPRITDCRTDDLDFCLPGCDSNRNSLGRYKPEETGAISSAGSDQLPYKQRVSGSNPLSPRRVSGVVAQFWLEHRPVTPEVASSSLVRPARNPLFKERVSCFKFRILPRNCSSSQFKSKCSLQQFFSKQCR